MEVNKIYQGDALEVLKTFPDESINMVLTSPPYWALRDYGTAIWEGGNDKCNHQVGRKARGNLSDFQQGNKGSFGDEAIKIGKKCPKCGAVRKDLQLGLEPTFQEYMSKLCDIFDEVKRVLRKDGTCWVNIGDTYGGSGGATGHTENTKNLGYTTSNMGASKGNQKATRGLEKSLIQIPSRFAIEMSNRGWILRNEIIWHKGNVMPTSVKDRFTVDFEKIFFFVKDRKYWFEQQTESATYTDSRYNKGNIRYKSRQTPVGVTVSDIRNKRTVWKINPKSFAEAHFAVYPEKLCEIPIKAGCPKGGIVLDPFFGSGTTAVVARYLDRKWVGIELNPEYIKIANRRLAQRKLL